MNINQLYKKFNQALFWNFSLYSLERALSLLLSVCLYKKLSIDDFSLWANTTSLIFLLLLWIDCGFKKSLPLYCPIFASCKVQMKKFIKTILLFKVAILFLTVPFFLLAINMITSISSNTYIEYLYPMVATLFFLEGLTATIKIIYHSYFRNKEFNTIYSISKTIQTIASLSVLFYIKNLNLNILSSIFIINIATKIATICYTLVYLKQFYKKNEKEIKKINYNKRIKEFSIHSAAMWFNTSLKSMTERNFLLPFITYCFGQTKGNIFKIAHDGAIFFQRIILKTIGSTDTSLFAHIKIVTNNDKNLMPAFTRLTKSLLWLCFPILGMLTLLVTCNQHYYFIPAKSFALFAVITSSYLLEIIVSPYERILEIKKMYFTLLCTYIPYIALFLITITYFSKITTYKLLSIIILIHSTRLISTYTIAYLAHKKLQLKYPFGLMKKLLLIIGVFCFTIKIILR